MSSINPLRFGVAGNQYLKQDVANESKQSKAREENTSRKEEKNIDSNSVFNYMAAQNADIVPSASKKTINVSKYVNPEQEARIADFMKSFESDYEAAYEITEEEFQGLSETAISGLALSYLDSAYEQ